MNREYLLGVELGSDYARLGLVDLSGKITKKHEIVLGKSKNALDKLSEVFDTIKRLKKEKIIGIGVGVSGIVDSKKGTVLKSGIKWLSGQNIKRLFEQKTNLPSFVDNIALCMAMSENKIGLARKYETFILLNLDENIDSAMVIDGKLCRGNSNIYGQVGHLVVQNNGNKCYCGIKGCLNAYSSPNGILNRYNQLFKKKLSFEEVSKLSRKNKKIKTLFDEASTYFSDALLNSVILTSPEAILFYGPMSNNKIYANAEKKISKSDDSFKKVKISSISSENAGILGAASIIRK